MNTEELKILRNGYYLEIVKITKETNINDPKEMKDKLYEIIAILDKIIEIDNQLGGKDNE